MSDKELVNNLVNKIINGENAEAQQDVYAILASKLDSALNDKKMELAQNIYSEPVEASETSDDV